MNKVFKKYPSICSKVNWNWKFESQKEKISKMNNLAWTIDLKVSRGPVTGGAGMFLTCQQIPNGDRAGT